ncbi:MAG: universal stress protein [Caldilineales bacterium]
MNDELALAAAVRDFREARRRAALDDLKARLTGKSDDLLSYEAVRDLLQAEGSISRGLREIPLHAVVGSVGRYHDFTRSFLPRRDSDVERWTKVKLKALYHGGMAPIEVYQLGDVYFVLDGNHRVSVARQLGAQTIQAYVTEIPVRVPITPDISADDLIIKARYARFLIHTALDETRPQADLLVTAPGQYRKLEEQIEAYRRVCNERQAAEVSTHQAATAWYDAVYAPVAVLIRESNLLQAFSGRTEADLFLWITDRQQELHRQLGWQVNPQRVVKELAQRRTPESVPASLPVAAPLPVQEALFPEILVPISGTGHGWAALDQALLVAQREGSVLRGYHVVRSFSREAATRSDTVRRTFDERCRAAGVSGHLVIEPGAVTQSICRRASWTDLVIANLAYPPQLSFQGRLRSGFRTLVQRCDRPLLAVPAVSSLRRALVAFDGSLRAWEALTLAACLAMRWQIPLAVVTVLEETRTTADTLPQAEDYLSRFPLQVAFWQRAGAVAEVILQVAAEDDADLLIMGGYGYTPMWEAMLGSTVDRLLRQCRRPMLICQ